MNQFFNCEPCDKFFNGIAPYKDHLASEKHRKKVNPLYVAENSSNHINMSGEFENDPNIKKYGTEYKCLSCDVVMNSISTALSHSQGQKHLKTVARNTNSSDGAIAVNSETTLTSTLSDPDNYGIFEHEFSLRLIDIEEVLKDVKVVQVNDPIEF